jgi:hypothetical protein
MKFAPSLLLVATLAGTLAAFAQKPEMVPRIGVLVSGVQPSEHICVRAIRQGLADLGYTEGRTHVLDLRWTEGRPEQEAFPILGAELVKAGTVHGNAQAVMTTQSTFFYQHRQIFANLALQNRLPNSSGEPGAAQAGVLMTHGMSIEDSCYRTATLSTGSCKVPSRLTCRWKYRCATLWPST